MNERQATYVKSELRVHQSALKRIFGSPLAGPTHGAKLVEITRNGSAPVAEDGVKRNELYRIEVELTGQGSKARLGGRQERSARVVA